MFGYLGNKNWICLGILKTEIEYVRLSRKQKNWICLGILKTEYEYVWVFIKLNTNISRYLENWTWICPGIWKTEYEYVRVFIKLNMNISGYLEKLKVNMSEYIETEHEYVQVSRKLNMHMSGYIKNCLWICSCITMYCIYYIYFHTILLYCYIVLRLGFYQYIVSQLRASFENHEKCIWLLPFNSIIIIAILIYFIMIRPCLLEQWL